MRIGIDARGLDGNRTGISTYIEQIISKTNELNKEQNEYILYSNRNINLDLNFDKNITKKVIPKSIGTFWLYFSLPKILSQDKIDVFWGTQHCLPKKNKYTKNIRYVLTVHDLAIHKLKTVGQLKNTIIQKLFLKKSCKNAEIIIADSKSTKQDIVDIFGINQNKIQVVYLGTNFTVNYNINAKEEKNIFKKFKIEDKNYIFFVSTIEPRKNIVTLIHAFEKIKEKKKSSLKLILAGGLGWKYQDVLKAIDESKYQNDINLAGYISKEEKQCLMHNCKCFVYPSLYEGFGLPILEAMANDAIVVTSNVSSIPEVGGEAALYFNNVKDATELSEKIDEAMNLDNDKKDKLIDLGHKQVKKFTWDKCAKEIIDILLKK